jgi:hypothetical protein
MAVSRRAPAKAKGAKKKVGRPKGSKDVRKRKGRSDVGKRRGPRKR